VFTDVTDASKASSPIKAASQQTSPGRRASFQPPTPSPTPPPPLTTVPPMAPLPPSPPPPVPPHPSSPRPAPSTPSATAQTEPISSVKRSAVQPAPKMMAPSAPPPPPPAPPPPSSPPRVPPTASASRAYHGDSLPSVDTERAASSAALHTEGHREFSRAYTSLTGTTARTEASTRSPFPDKNESSVAGDSPLFSPALPPSPRPMWTVEREDKETEEERARNTPAHTHARTHTHTHTHTHTGPAHKTGQINVGEAIHEIDGRKVHDLGLEKAIAVMRGPPASNIGIMLHNDLDGKRIVEEVKRASNVQHICDTSQQNGIHEHSAPAEKIEMRSETSRGARGLSRYEAALMGISEIFRRPDGGGDSLSTQQFVVQAEVGFATEGAGGLVLPSSTRKGQISPVSILRPSDCSYCGALPGSTGKKGRQLRFRRCAGCKSIDYCSERCQRKHWKETHKAECYRLHAREAKNAPAYQHNQGGYGFVPSVAHSSANARPHIYHIATSDSPNLPATPEFNTTRRNERDQDLNILQRMGDLNTPPPRARCVWLFIHPIRFVFMSCL
jgi:hypothetical protein